MLLDERTLYEQGSKICQQYSDLTMRIRTIAQTVQIAYAVAIGLVLARATEAIGSGHLPLSRVGAVLVALGAIAAVFGRVLEVLNNHYSQAFEAVRDISLVELERRVTWRQASLVGPWEAHQKHRVKSGRNKKYAWVLPFRALIGLGCAGILVGIVMLILGLTSDG